MRIAVRGGTLLLLLLLPLLLLAAVATSVRPAPQDANADRGRAYWDGCEVSRAATRSPPCVYGAVRSRTTVVLFGDSHAVHLFPAMRRVAERRHWRLVVLGKSGCPPADIVGIRRDRQRVYRECRAWRRAALDRIAHRERAPLVVTSMSDATAVVAEHTAQQVVRRLHGTRRLRALGRGYALTARRLVADGARIVAIRDVPRPPWDMPTCVAQWLQDLRHCAFEKSAGRPEPDPTDALRGIAGVTVLDPVGRLCFGRLCPGVIDDRLVYRQGGHLTATFAATLTPWLDRRLPAIPSRAARGSIVRDRAFGRPYRRPGAGAVARAAPRRDHGVIPPSPTRRTR